MNKDLFKQRGTEIAIFSATFLIGLCSVIYGIAVDDESKVLAGCLPTCISVLILLQIAKDFYYERCLEAHKELIESYKRLQVSYEEGAVIKDALIENYKELYLNAREQIAIYETGDSWQKGQKSTDAATI